MEIRIFSKIVRTSEDVASVDLVVDTAVALLDHEGSIDTPGVVPGVNCEPVVQAVLDTPADELDCMSTQACTSLVVIHTTAVSKEVLVNCEGS